MQTMTDAERNIMLQHGAYWKDKLNQDIAIVYGPVADPKGGYGIGIVQVDSEDQLLELMKNDPGAAINNYEWYPMVRAVKK